MTTQQFGIVGGRVTGRSHIERGQGCDDAFAFAKLGDSVQVLAVADGAGSVTETSAWGSHVATQYVTSPHVARRAVLGLATAECADQAEAAMHSLFLGALSEVVLTAKSMDLRPESLYTTLAVAIITPRGTYVAQIGDGIMALSIDGQARTVLVEDKGDHPVNETWFLQHLARGDRGQWRFSEYCQVEGVALSTDGLQFVATLRRQHFAAAPGFFETAWQLVGEGRGDSWLDAVLRKINGLPFAKEPGGDDKTLVVAVRPLLPDDDWLDDALTGGFEQEGSPMPALPPRNSSGDDPVDDARAEEPSDDGEAEAVTHSPPERASSFEWMSSVFLRRNHPIAQDETAEASEEGVG